MIKLLIFDLDGTLIDSAPDIIATVNEVMEKHGKPSLPDQTIIAAIGDGLKALVHGLFPEARVGSAMAAQLEEDFLVSYTRNLVQRTRAFPGAEEFLGACSLQTAIVTNKNIALTRQTLAQLKLDRFPWLRVFGADSLSERKPHPLPLQEVMRAANAEPHETLMIGDGRPDMLAAQAAGVRAVAVEFGYLPTATLLALGATATLRSYAELEVLVQRLGRSPSA